MAAVIAVSTAATFEVTGGGLVGPPPNETGHVPVIALPDNTVEQLVSQSTFPLITSLLRLIVPEAKLPTPILALTGGVLISPPEPPSLTKRP